MELNIQRWREKESERNRKGEREMSTSKTGNI